MSISSIIKKLPLERIVVKSGYGRRGDFDRVGADALRAVGGSTDHKGIDLEAAENTNVFAVGDGKVTHASPQTDFITGAATGYGLYVEITHAPTSTGLTVKTRYAHLNSVSCQLNQRITAGAVLGKSGGERGNLNAGSSTGPHLHFEILVGGEKLDPQPFFIAIQNGTPIDDSFIVGQNIAAGLRRYSSQGTSAEPTAPGPTSITPYIASLDSFHPKIQYELTRRRMSSETANVHMPFVRLTSLTKVLGKNLEGTPLDSVEDAWCPSLGIVGEPEVSFDDLLSPRSGRSTVGYATKITGQSNDTLVYGRVPVLVEASTDDSPNLDPPNIAPAGIVNMTAERSTAGPMGVRGGLFKANLKIVANSLGQFNALLRYFLRPGTRVVLEMGRESTSTTQRPLKYFNWKQSSKDLETYFQGMVTLKTGQKDMINEYIFDNYGNYELFIGYVVTFKSKYTKNNQFEIDLTIHSVQQFEVAVKVTGANSICPGNGIADGSKSLDVEEYFKAERSSFENNFYKVLADTQTPNSRRTELYDIWKNHVIELRGNGTNAPHAGTTQNGYLVSWKFFINVILRDTKYGLMSLFQVDPDQDAATLSLLQSNLPPAIGDEYTPTPRDLKLRDNEVGHHPDLRSTNPGVMVIYNPDAQSKTSARTLAEIREKIRRAANNTGNLNKVENAIKEAAENNFVPPFKVLRTQDATGTTGISSLTQGIWINSNAIIDAFNSVDILTNGLVKLLNAMNMATEGYWNLQLLSDDLNSPGTHVIDMGLSKPNNKQILPKSKDDLVAQSTDGASDTQWLQFNTIKNATEAVGDKVEPEFLYVFNRATSTYEQDDIGGELLDISLESSLPQVIAVQAIAGVGGVAQRGTLEAIDINELRRISLIDTYPKNCPPCRADLTQVERYYTRLTNADGNIAVRGNVETGRRETNQGGTVITTEEVVKFEPPVLTPQEYVNIARIAVLAGEFAGGSESDRIAAENKVIEEELQRGLTRVNGIPEESSGRGARFLDWLLTRRQPERDRVNTGLAVGRAQLRALIEASRRDMINEEGKQLAIYKEYTGAFGSVLELIEFDRTLMMQRLDKDSGTGTACMDSGTSSEVHSFSSSNLTKTIVDLTLPGIGGIQLFQSFWVDRTPRILNSGYYVVTKISHDFSIDKGWTTKIQGRFRYKSRIKQREERTQAQSGTPVTQ